MHIHKMARTSAASRCLAALVLALTSAACTEAPPSGPDLANGSPTEARSSRPLAFTTIHFPGAIATVPQGINAGGDIVGWYVMPGAVFHGFLLRNGEFTTIDYPGAAGTQARGIGPGGDIVGSYWLPGEPGVAFHGYRLTPQGEFVNADFPGHLYTIAQRILPDGTILGCRHDHDLMSTMRGGAMRGDTYVETDAFASMHNGGTASGRRIAGLYTNMMAGRTESYIIDDGVFSPFMVPGSRSTAAWDMNSRGDVAGVFQDASGAIHGFVLSDDEVRVIDFPGAAATRVFGINAGGDLVGSYVLGGQTRGFLASATKQHNR